MTVTVDPARCIGCGMCAYAAPEVFAIVGRHSTVIAQPEPGRSAGFPTQPTAGPVNAIRVTR